MKTKIITKISSNKLYINDEEEIIDISPDIIYEFKLSVGMDIDQIYTKILYESIKQKAMYYYYLKPRTRYELISKLKLKYKNVELINAVLDYMEEERYIDDVDFALSYILTHKNSRQKNTMKLMQRGIKKADIDLAYEEVPKEQETDILSEEVERLYNFGYDKAEIIVKLMRKGYRYSDIKEILKEME